MGQKEIIVLSTDKHRGYINKKDIGAERQGRGQRKHHLVKAELKKKKKRKKSLNALRTVYIKKWIVSLLTMSQPLMSQLSWERNLLCHAPRVAHILLTLTFLMFR